MKTKQWLAILLSAALLFSLCAFGPGIFAGATPDLTPNSLVNAGLYPQSIVTDPTLIGQLDAIGAGDDVPLDGARYAYMNGDWFLYEPIAWRVLEVDEEEDTVLLLSDKVIETHAFSTVHIPDPLPEEWEKLDAFLSWLEQNLMLRAFGPDLDYWNWEYLQPIWTELTVIVPISSILPMPVTEGEWVPVSIPTEDQLKSGKWGLGSNGSRIAAPSDYAVALGVHTDGASARWWALSCKQLSGCFSNQYGVGTCVDYDGSMHAPYTGYEDPGMGMRPMIKLKRADLEPQPITFHENGGENAPAPQPVNYGETLVLTGNAPFRVGYTFLGWAEDPAAETPDYLPGHTWFESPGRLVGFEYARSRPVDLYAVWELTCYPVTYDANGGTGAPLAQNKLHDVPLALSDAAPTRGEGYIFKGWATTASATAPQYQPGAAYTGNAALSLYAVWQPVTYQLAFHTRSNTDDVLTFRTYHDKPFPLGNILACFPAALTRESCVLLGWSENPAATVPDYPPDGVLEDFNRSATFYAVWEFSKDVVDFDTSNVTVTPALAFPPGTVMHATAWSNDYWMTFTERAPIMTYEIKFHSADGSNTNVQPNGNVTVRLSVPANYLETGGDPARLFVSYLGQILTTTLVQIDGVYYLEFVTDHFSEYCIEWIPAPGEDDGQGDDDQGQNNQDDNNQGEDNQGEDNQDNNSQNDNSQDDNTQAQGGGTQTQAAALKWWEKLAPWLRMLLRYLCFGWIWMI